MSKLRNPRAYGVPIKGREFGKRFQEGSDEVAGPTGRGYGAPAGTAGTTGGGTVACQFLFDESAPPTTIVDEANGITLTALATPTMEQTLTGDFSGITPGVLHTGSAAWRKLTATPECALGTGDAVLEWDGSFDGGGTGAYYIFTTENASFQNGIYVVYILGATDMQIDLDQGGTGVRVDISCGTLTDSVMRKYRLVLDRSGNAELFIDGVSQGTASIASASAVNLGADQCFVGTGPNTGNPILGTLGQLRLTLGTTTANYDGPGGG